MVFRFVVRKVAARGPCRTNGGHFILATDVRSLPFPKESGSGVQARTKIGLVLLSLHMIHDATVVRQKTLVAPIQIDGPILSTHPIQVYVSKLDLCGEHHT